MMHCDILSVLMIVVGVIGLILIFHNHDDRYNRK